MANEHTIDVLRELVVAASAAVPFPEDPHVTLHHRPVETRLVDALRRAEQHIAALELAGLRSVRRMERVGEKQ